MGKKGSWFSAIKRVFIPTSKEKLVDGFEKRDAKEKKKKGLGKLKHGPSFIPLFKQPSTIEEILGEAEREHHLIDFRPISPFEQPSTPSIIPSRGTTPYQDALSPWTPTPQRVTTPRSCTPQRLVSPINGSTSQRACLAPKNTTPHRIVSSPKEVASSSSFSQGAAPLNVGASSRSTSSRYVQRPRPEPTLRYQNICATRIQATYRGYTARRSYRSLRGLVRLQGVVKGQSVKRQTVNAMKCMQLLVRVQTQIQSRRIQMLENQAVQRQMNDNGKLNLSQVPENGNPGEWEDSRLTKEEIEARTQRKYEAMMKRERAMAYAYSHQLWKASPKTPQAALMDIRSSGGFPWWWNWLDRPDRNSSATPTKKPSESEAIKNIFSTPPRPQTTSPFMARGSSSYSQQNLGFDHLGPATPGSTRSAAAVPSRTKHVGNHITKPRATNVENSPFGGRFKDDESLTSCPAFSAPRYMEPTASAKAKVKSGSEASPDQVQARKKRVFGSFKWSNRGSLFSATSTPGREKGGQKMLEKQSVGGLSGDSTVSMPATVGRKPFNRYV